MCTPVASTPVLTFKEEHVPSEAAQGGRICGAAMAWWLPPLLRTAAQRRPARRGR